MKIANNAKAKIPNSIPVIAGSVIVIIVYTPRNQKIENQYTSRLSLQQEIDFLLLATKKRFHFLPEFVFRQAKKCYLR